MYLVDEPKKCSTLFNLDDLHLPAKSISSIYFPLILPSLCHFFGSRIRPQPLVTPPQSQNRCIFSTVGMRLFEGLLKVLKDNI